MNNETPISQKYALFFDHLKRYVSAIAYFCSFLHYMLHTYRHTDIQSL